MTTSTLVTVTALLSVIYLLAGTLVADRVAERSGNDTVVLKVVVVLLWPIVATGIQLLWLAGHSDWHLR